MFGKLIAEFMDAEPTLWVMSNSGEDMRERIRAALAGCIASAMASPPFALIKARHIRRLTSKLTSNIKVL
jgi:hypothetical protein